MDFPQVGTVALYKETTEYFQNRDREVNIP